MSGFAAIFHRDGHPLEAGQLHRMNEAIRHRGPDGSGCWIEGPVGLAHQMLRTTPEALHETQPCVSPHGDVVLVYDGLVDNADEIRQAAQSRRLRVADDTDATAILLAYELWRDECAAHLSGDFSFALWDRSVNRFLCARDRLGIRPFYYHLSEHLFACGSELRQLLCHPNIREDLNEGMAAEYLSNNVTSVDETLYRDIQRLPAGHALTVARDRHVLRRYWHFDPARKIRFKTDNEYAEALLNEIRRAVRACARSTAPLAIEVSGGLDSTTVASIARQMAADGDLAVPVETFNVAYPGLDCDEGEYVREADAQWQRCTTRVPFALPSQPEFETSLAAHRDFPECPNGMAQHPLYRAARNRNCRVLLGGIGGDDCLTGHYLHYVDLVKQMRLRAIRRQMRDDGLPARAFVRFALRPLVPGIVRRAARVVRRGYPNWISDRFAKTVSLSDRLYRPRFNHRCWQSRAQEEIFRDLTHGWPCYVHETLSRVHAEHGLEQRSPLLRLNVVEFALAIPEDQRWRGTQTKYVLRQAMKGILPETIRTRATKADFGAMFPRVFSRLDAASSFRSMRLTSLGWLDPGEIGRLQARFDAWQSHSYIGNVAIWPLWMIFGVESWLTRNHVPSREDI